MNFTLRAMTIHDYPEVMSLWQQTEGVGLTESDSEEGIDAFLRRNPGMSAVATSGELLGAVLCGHDGRRGYLHHLAVVPSRRRQGVASQLISWCFRGLADQGIQKCNVFLLDSNEGGSSFWRHNEWSRRHDLRVFQKAVTSTQGGRERGGNPWTG